MSGSIEHYFVEKRSSGEIAPAPWKNGQGTTLELAKFPKDAQIANLDFLWRISIATIKTPGPFSPFPCFDRQIVLLDGPAPTLVHRIENETPTKVTLRPFQPHCFAGESSTACSFPSDGGPCRDFNVMTRRGTITALTEFLNLAEGDAQRLPMRSDWHFVYVEQGSIKVEATGSDRQHLEAGDLLLLTRNRSLDTGEAPVTLDLRGIKGKSIPVLLVSMEFLNK